MTALGVDTQITILAAGLMFVWALALGVIKYRQILASPESAAHPYIDIAHRSALMYAFASMLVAVFVELSAWPATVNLSAAAALTFFFVAAVASYMTHGLREDTTNQFEHPSRSVRAFMSLHIIGSVGGFSVLLMGYVVSLLA